jgi:hypothetical protein
VKHTFHFARCKKHPTAPVRFWSLLHCAIFSACTDCNRDKGVTSATDPDSVVTGYNSGENHYSKHYDKFQIVITRLPPRTLRGLRVGTETYEAVMDRAEALVNADPAKYAVTEWTDPVQEAKELRWKKQGRL